jgi:hypothetical protein
MKYRDPATGELLDVDAALDPVILDRLNRIQGVAIVETCAGHDGSRPYIALFAHHDHAVSIMNAAVRAQVASLIHLQPDLDDFPYRTRVVLEGFESGSPGWWRVVVSFLEGTSAR